MKSNLASTFSVASNPFVGCDHRSSKFVEQVKLEDREVLLVRRSEIAGLRSMGQQAFSLTFERNRTSLRHSLPLTEGARRTSGRENDGVP
jgi:hypothetical protein